MSNIYIVASDLGSGGVKSLVVDESGCVVASAQSEYPTSYPRPGWSEQNPQDWLDAVGLTVRKVLNRAEVPLTRIAAYSIAGVTHNAVLLGGNGKPIRPSIILYDTRSEKECIDLERRWGNRISKKTLNNISPLWTWPQLQWIKKHEPETWAAIDKILFQKDYIRNVLAPSPVTDFIDAAGSLLFDPQSNEWIEEFLADLSLPPTTFPEAVHATEIVGTIDDYGQALTGIPKGTPVIAGTTDTAAETFGAGALWPGQGIVKLASVGRIICVTTRPLIESNGLNYRHVLKDLWYPGTGTKYATSSYRWLRDIMWSNSGFDEMDKAAAGVMPGSEGLLFHPHLLGEWAPYWDDKLRGDFVGISIRHKRPHFTRAVMEGVAFALRDGLEHAQNLGLHFKDIRLIGKGSISNLWPQIITDVFNRSTVIPKEPDAAYGMALIAGMSLGIFPNDIDGISTLIQISAKCEPDPACVEIYRVLFGIYQETDRALRSIVHQLTDFDNECSISNLEVNGNESESYPIEYDST